MSIPVDTGRDRDRGRRRTTTAISDCKAVALQGFSRDRGSALADPRSCAELALVVVGGGVAGLFAALCAAAEGDVLVLTKGSLLSSTSLLAQGGIAAAIGEDDDPVLHAEDTLRTGRGLCRPSAVSVLTNEAPARIRDLVELGVEFDEGLGLEGGHSRRRVVHAGGAATGDRVARKLAERVLHHPRIQVAEGERMLSIWRDAERCVGVVTDRRPVAARATLLSTGGAAALWERTTNPAGAVGEGMAAAYRAGAALADLEFVQFHPTTLVDSSLLLSEALRGEGALLLDDQGNRFTDELAPRDVVAREIAARGTVLLDLRTIDRGRFPTLMGSLVEEGYDPAEAPIPVAPAAHYTVGGVLTDLDGRSELDGLYAAGECAATGVHGANRLASNSLLECLVFGRRAALAALAEPELPSRLPAIPDPPVTEPVTPELRSALWRDCGLIRDAEGLRHLLDEPHLLTRLIAETALTREESRGSHFRADFPSESEELERHVVLRQRSEPELETWL
jgi:L-aspartate oxidase